MKTSLVQVLSSISKKSIFFQKKTYNGWLKNVIIYYWSNRILRIYTLASDKNLEIFLLLFKAVIYPNQTKYIYFN